MSNLKSRAPEKKTPNLDSFISGADEKTTPKKRKTTCKGGLFKKNDYPSAQPSRLSLDAQ